MWYEVQFIAIWSFSILVILIAPAAAAASFFTQPYVCWAVSVWCAFWAFMVRQRGSKIAIRVAAWPGWCMGDMTPTPCSPEVLLAKLDGMPTIVGSGWGYFLKRYMTPAPRLFMHAFTGPMPGERRKKPTQRRWASGTTLDTIIHAFKKEGYVLPSHPSNTDITIGSWFAMGNHGNSGDAGRGSSTAFKDATVIDLYQKKIFFNVTNARLRAWFDKHPRRYLIVDVAFQNLERDRDIQKRGIEIPLDMPQTGEQAAEDWLQAGAILRVCFLGAARSMAIGIRWEEPYQMTSHRDPHCCSRFCTFMQADVCSICCGCHESMKHWNGVTLLSEANQWVPPILPFNSLLVVLQGYRNFEIVCDIQLDGKILWTLMKKLKDMHDEFGGRTEIRYGTRYLFLDMVMTSGFQTPFIILDELGVEKIALHPGKWMPDSIILKEITLGELYGLRVDDVLYD